MMTRKQWVVLTGAALLCGALLYLPSGTDAAPEKALPKAEMGKTVPDFTLKDAYGKEFKLSDFKNRIIVLEWINQKCPVSHMAHTNKVMQDTYKKYATKGVIWLAIDSSHFAKPEDNRVYAAQEGLAYPILHDPEGKVGHAFEARTTPHMFVIDKTGKLVYNGGIDEKGKENYVADAIQNLLDGKPVARPESRPRGCGVKYKP